MKVLWTLKELFKPLEDSQLAVDEFDHSNLISILMVNSFNLTLN